MYVNLRRTQVRFKRTTIIIGAVVNYILSRFLSKMAIGCLCALSLSAHAASVPTVTTSGIPSEQFVGEQFCFTATFSTAGDTGYGPYMQLFLKPDFDFSSATLFGLAVNSTLVGTFPSVTTDPISGEPVSGPSGSEFYTLQLPIGSVTNGGAPLNTNICIDVDVNAIADVLQTNAIQVTPVFQYGDTPTGSTAVTGTVTSHNITPTVIEYREADLTDEEENPPGPEFQYNIQIIADIASTRTVSPITYPRVNLTNNRQFVGPIENIGGVSCTAIVTNSSGQVQSGDLPFTPTHMSDPGGTVDVNCASGTGTTGEASDVSINIPVYSIDHLDPQVCSFEDPSNNRNTTKHVVIRKSASNTSIVPGDVITFSLAFEVSEYINATNTSITDVMPDGLTYNGVQTMTVGGNSFSITPTVSNNTPAGGQTTVFYDLSAAYGAVFNSTTTGVITYTATVDEYYSNNNPLRSNDPLTNNVILNYDVENGATNCYDDSSAALRVIPLTISKTIINPTSEFQPGQSVNFRLRLDIPSGDTKNIVFNDYFPLPALLVNGMDTTLDLSVNTSISLGPNDTLGLTPISITTDATSNGLSIQWPDVDSNKAEVIEVDILAQVISTDPFADGLFLTNVFEQTAENTANSTSSLYTGVSFVVRSPVLTIEKKVTPTTTVDAGDTVNYTIDVTNIGGADAYESTIRDVLPSGINSNTCTINNQPVGSGDLFSAGYTLSSVIAPNGTASFAFSCIVDTSIQISTIHRNTAYVSWASANGAPHFPEVNDTADFSTSPRLSQKTIVGTNKTHTSDSGVGTSADPRIVSVGETIRFQLAVTIPEGTSNSASLYDYLPSGLQYIVGSAKVALISDGGISSTFACTSGNNLQITGDTITTPTCGINPSGSSFGSGTDATFILGNLVNSDDDANDEYIVIEFDALVMDNSVNQQSLKSYNVFRSRFNNVYFSYSGRVYYSVVEPQLTLVTTATATSLETINMTVGVTNTGNSNAFQVTGNDGSPWSITLQNGLMNINNISVNTIGNVYENGTTTAITAADFVVSGINNETLTLSKILQFDPSAEFTINFDSQVVPGLSPGTTLTTVVFEYASQVAGGLAEGVRTGIGINSGSGNMPVTIKTILDDYRTEAELNVYSLNGKVYEDINSDGTYDSGEAGISGVTVVLYSASTNSCRSVQTDGMGDYSFFPVSPGDYQIIESAREARPIPSQCPAIEKDPSGYASTTNNTIPLTVSDRSFDDQNFGDLQGPAFAPNHDDSILPGNVTFYAHTFTTPADGVVKFTGSASGAIATGWSSVIYRDSDCDGVLNGTEANASFDGLNLAISGGGRLCIINKVYAPVNAPINDKHQVTITAGFTYSGGNVVDLTINDVTTVSGNVSPTTSVTPSVGASKLELRKTVENIDQLTAETSTLNEAKPGDVLKYRIYYRNTGTGPIIDLRVNDLTPDFTEFVLGSGSCGSTPSGMTCMPVIAADQSIHWDFTGSLVAGESGDVSYKVKVNN